MHIEFSYSEDHDSYVSKHLAATKSLNDNKCGMQTKKRSKFLFSSSNDYFNRMRLPMQYKRHTIVFEDVHGLLGLQKRD